MNTALKAIRLLAVLALAGFSLIVLFRNEESARSRWDPSNPFDNPVDKWEARLQAIPGLLPPGLNIVGYAADWDIPGLAYNPVDQDAEYVTTQYALAPLIVEPGLDHEWIIGNFTSPGFERWLEENLPAYEITNLKYGVYLIHRTGP